MTTDSDVGEFVPRRAALSREVLIDAAVHIARSEGLEALTMRRLAVATERAPMTLYSYIPNKEALLELVADALLARVEVPVGRWDRALTELSLSMWRAMGEAAGLGTYLWKHVPYLFTPQGLRLADGAIGLLMEGGFRPADARQALEALMTYVTGDAQRLDAGVVPTRGSQARRVKGYANLEAVVASTSGGRRHPQRPEEAFGYGLELFMVGLRRDTRRQPRRPTRAT